MKLIVQIPCYNEAETLGITIDAIPRTVPGFDVVELLIIDDGSQDATVAVARAHGVEHVVSFTKNQGLARGFMAGVDACLKLGADVIVNTDADNQYCADDISVLVAPILAGDADIVVGARPISQIRHFSPVKKLFQKIGSWAVRMASNTTIPDAPSGFRAFTRKAALTFNVFNEYTYTLETIIQAGQKNMAIVSVPIRTSEGELRPSRLMKSAVSYIKKSIVTIIRIFVVYRPFRFFFTIGTLGVVAGTLIGLRYLYFLFFTGDGSGHLQSLVFASILLGVGFQTILTAFLADLMAVNRKQTEDIQIRIRSMEAEREARAKRD